MVGLRGKLGRFLVLELGSHELDEVACACGANSELYTQCFSGYRPLVSYAMSCVFSPCPRQECLRRGPNYCLLATSLSLVVDSGLRLRCVVVRHIAGQLG